MPFRRGYLLRGAPVSGKTSIIHSLPSALGRNFYVVTLSHRHGSLVKDIDAAFMHGFSRGVMSSSAGSSAEPVTVCPPSSRQDVTRVAAANPGGLPPLGGSKIALDGLLDALGSVSATRPGRTNLHEEFRLASRFQAGALFRCLQ